MLCGPLQCQVPRPQSHNTEHRRTHIPASTHASSTTRTVWNKRLALFFIFICLNTLSEARTRSMKALSGFVVVQRVKNRQRQRNKDSSKSFMCHGIMREWTTHSHESVSSLFSTWAVNLMKWVTFLDGKCHVL